MYYYIRLNDCSSRGPGSVKVISTISIPAESKVSFGDAVSMLEAERDWLCLGCLFPAPLHMLCLRESRLSLTTRAQPRISFPAALSPPL